MLDDVGQAFRVGASTHPTALVPVSLARGSLILAVNRMGPRSECRYTLADSFENRSEIYAI